MIWTNFTCTIWQLHQMKTKLTVYYVPNANLAAIFNTSLSSGEEVRISKLDNALTTDHKLQSQLGCICSSCDKHS